MTLIDEIYNKIFLPIYFTNNLTIKVDLDPLLLSPSTCCVYLSLYLREKIMGERKK